MRHYTSDNANTKKGNAKYLKNIALLIIVALLMLSAGGCMLINNKPASRPTPPQVPEEQLPQPEPEVQPPYDEWSFLSEFSWQAGDLIIHFMNVGQGDGIFIQFPDATTMVIDGGNLLSSPGNYMRNYMSALGVTDKIDYVFLTHSHKDHCNGLAEIVPQYDIDYFYTPKLTPEQADTKAYERYYNAMLKKENAEIIYNIGLQQLPATDFSFTIYGAEEHRYDAIDANSDGDTVNYLSPIAVLEYMDRRIVLTGDAIEETEYDFMAMLGEQTLLKTDILKVGHHGSKTSTSPDFVSFLKPDYAVISVGGISPLHPHTTVLNALKDKSRGIEILRTDKQGAIVARVDKAGNLDILTEKRR